MTKSGEINSNNRSRLNLFVPNSHHGVWHIFSIRVAKP